MTTTNKKNTGMSLRFAMEKDACYAAAVAALTSAQKREDAERQRPMLLLDGRSDGRTRRLPKATMLDL